MHTHSLFAAAILCLSSMPAEPEAVYNKATPSLVHRNLNHDCVYRAFQCAVHDESSALIYIGIVCLAMGVCVAAGCFFVNYKVCSQLPMTDKFCDLLPSGLTLYACIMLHVHCHGALYAA